MERNAALASGSDLEGSIRENSYMKFSTENADHNVCTLDGKNTFRVMAMLICISNGDFTEKIISRKKELEKDFLNEGSVKLLTYKEKKYMLNKIHFQKIPNLKVSKNNLDILWKISCFF